MKLYPDYYEYFGKEKYKRQMAIIETARVNDFFKKHITKSIMSSHEFFALNKTEADAKIVAYIKVDGPAEDSNSNIYTATANVNEYANNANVGHDLIVGKGYGNSIKSALNSLLGKEELVENKLDSIQFYFDMTNGSLIISSPNGKNIVSCINPKNNINVNTNTQFFNSIAESLNDLETKLEKEMNTSCM